MNKYCSALLFPITVAFIITISSHAQDLKVATISKMCIDRENKTHGMHFQLPELHSCTALVNAASQFFFNDSANSTLADAAKRHIAHFASNKTLNPNIKTDYHHYYTMKKIIEAPGNFTCWFLSKRENVYRKYTTRTTVDEMSIIYDIANNRALKIDDLFISGKDEEIKSIIGDRRQQINSAIYEIKSKLKNIAELRIREVGISKDNKRHGVNFDILSPIQLDSVACHFFFNDSTSNSIEKAVDKYMGQYKAMEAYAYDTDFRHVYTMKNVSVCKNFTNWLLTKKEYSTNGDTQKTKTSLWNIVYHSGDEHPVSIDDVFIPEEADRIKRVIGTRRPQLLVGKDAVVWGIMQKGELVSEQVDYAKRGNLFNENFCEEFGMDHFSGSPYFGGGTFLTTDYMTVHGETVPPNSELFFPAGHEGFTQYLDTFIKYPADAKKENIEGTVTLSFTVKAFTGDVSDIVVEKSAHPLLDKEAVRVINEMPRCTYWPGGQPRWTWIPGTKASIPSDMRMECQVPFYLKKQNN